MTSQTNQKLGQCHACGGTISKTAKSCPHCGQKKPFQGRKELSPLVTWSVITIGTLIGLSTLADGLSKGAGSRAPSYSESSSRMLCEDAIKSFVNNPSTLKINSLSGYASDVTGGGVRRITQTFSAKNSFGLQKTFDAYCLISPNGQLQDFKAIEQGS